LGGTLLSNRTIIIAIYVILAIGLVMPLCDAMVDGTAIIAIRTKDPLWLGHVGVAFENEDGTWTYGAIEGPPGDLQFLSTYRKEINIPWPKINIKDLGSIKDFPIQIESKSISIPWINNFWSAYVRPNSGIENGGWVQGKGIDDKLMTEEDVYSKFGSWPYDKIKKISVPIAYPDKAIEEIKKFPNNGFLVISNNCLDNSMKVLEAYGVKDLPSYPSRNPLSYPKTINIVPRVFFNRVAGDLYSWDSSKTEYTPVETPTPTVIDTSTSERSKDVKSIPDPWIKTFGGSKYDRVGDVLEAIDGGYIIVGGTDSFGSGGMDLLLIKTDANFNEVWRKTIGGPTYEWGNSIQHTSDGGYIVVGKVWIENQDYFWLVKTDIDGNKLWENTLRISEGEGGKSIQQTSDGGYIIAGTTPYKNTGNAILIKIDEQGNELWEREFGYGFEWGFSVRQTDDQGYILTGITGSLSYGTPGDVLLVKTDEFGNEIWTKNFGGDYPDEGHSVQQSPDGGYLVAGGTSSFGSGDWDGWLIKTDSEGYEIWSKTFGLDSYDSINSIYPTYDGGYILAGETESFGKGGSDAWLIKIDFDGNEVWNKTFGGDSSDKGISALQIDDGFLLAGSTYSFGEGQVDIFLIKTDLNGNPIVVSIH